MGIQGLTKILAKSKTWRSLTRSKCDLEQLSQLGMKIPNKTNSAIKITGEYHNGSCADFILFKDKSGNSLGSISLFPNGKRIEIGIERGVVSCASTPKSSEICNQFFDPRNKLYTRKTFEGDTLINEQNTFSEVYKLEDYAKNQSEKYWKQNLGINKPEDKIYQTVIRTSKTTNANGTTDFSQEIMQIETGSKPSKLRMKSTSQMAEDGEVTLQNLEQNGVDMDTTNPYFQLLHMESHDMLKGAYAEIVKRRGLKGIEPPLLFSDNSNVFSGKYVQAAGLAARDNSYVGINMNSITTKNGTKSLLAFRLGHECEHCFTQHANIHRAGLEDKRSDNPISRKFYDGIMQRFKPIKKGTKEFKDAEIYLNEEKNYDKIVWDENGKINDRGHASLKVENDANDLGGSVENKFFHNCLNDFVKNFSLFNSHYPMKIF